MSEYGKMMMAHMSGANTMSSLALARELGVVQCFLDSTSSMTSQEIADKLDLRERYVRELLAALATGEVIRVDDTSKLFHVPEENKSTLLSMSIAARIIPLHGQRFEAVKRCFRKSGPAGIKYADFPGFFDILQEFLVLVKKDIIDLDILPAITDLEKKLEIGVKVAEFGSATGTILNKLAARFPKSYFTGSDVAVRPLEVARADAASQNITNVQYEIYDLEKLPDTMSETMDWVLIRDVIHDLPYPQKAVSEIYKIIKPGGVFSLIDIGMSGEVAKEVGDPMSSVYYTLSTQFCIPESYQRPDSAAVGAGWGRPLTREILNKAGFTIVTERESHYDPKEVHYVCQK